jgi:hypothetical protein
MIEEAVTQGRKDPAQMSSAPSPKARALVLTELAAGGEPGGR